MSNSQLYIDFIENKFNLEDEKNFVNKLANDDEFRSGFKGFLSIDSDIKSNIKIFGPSMVETNEIYSKLGYTIPAAYKPDLPITTSYGSFFKSQSFKYIASGLISSLATILIIMLSGYNLSKNNTVIVDKVNSGQTDKKIVSNINDSLYTKSIIPIIESIVSKQNKSKLFSNNTNKIVKNNIEISEKVDFNTEPNYDSKKTIKLSSLKPETNINFSNIIKQNKISAIEPLQLKVSEPNIAALGKDQKTKLGLSLEVKNYINWNVEDEKTFPSRLSKLNNFGISLFCKLSDNISIGTDIRQETFYGIYQGTDTFGILKNYEQQPNLTSFGIALKYNSNKFNDFQIIGQINLDANTFGYIIRPKLGFEYFLYDDISIIAGLEYSQMWFSHQSNWFKASKIGINYGINYKF